MEFTKMHGCGNDYIYVDCTKKPLNNKSEFSKFYSDRHKGIGSDGLICIYPSDVADFRMRMFNADGSEGDMCGNGIRCVGKFVRDHKMTDKLKIDIETNAGIKHLTIISEDEKESIISVDMGKAILDAPNIPVNLLGDKVIGKTVNAFGKEWLMTCVNTGNPHAVIFVDEITDELLNVYGPQFESSEYFPKRANIEFVKILNDKEIEMRVWERGSGETMACGTGSCASAVATYLNNKTQKSVLVHLRGGDLQIEIGDDMAITMIGSATTVYNGIV